MKIREKTFEELLSDLLGNLLRKDCWVMTKDEIITELVELILMQEKEIKKLKEKVRQVKQYIEVYEDYIKGE